MNAIKGRVERKYRLPPGILNLDTRQLRAPTVHFLLPIDKTMGEPKGRFGTFGERNNLLTLPEI
jgi:hypothetical protein